MRGSTRKSKQTPQHPVSAVLEYTGYSERYNKKLASLLVPGFTSNASAAAARIAAPFAAAAALNEAYFGAPREEVVYRGLSVSRTNEPGSAQALRPPRPGQTWWMERIWSTTSDASVAHDIMDPTPDSTCLLLRLTLPRGYPRVDVSPFLQSFLADPSRFVYANQKEVLLVPFAPGFAWRGPQLWRVTAVVPGTEVGLHARLRDVAKAVAHRQRVAKRAYRDNVTAFTLLEMEPVE